MAEANLTNIDHDTVGGRFRKSYATYTGAASYATGGDTGVKEKLGLRNIIQLTATPRNVASQDYGLIWDAANSKVIWATEGAQASNAADLSALAFDIQATGF